MSGPWAKYKNTVSESGPWIKYEDGRPTQHSNALNDAIINESSPDVTIADRLITKNLANSPGAVVEYFGKNRPDLDVRNYSGEIQVRPKGDTEWRKLDANNGYFDTLKGMASLTPQGMLANKLINGEWINPQGKEALADAGDLASDVVGGATTAAATAASTMTGPAAPVVAPLAAGGTAAGYEALRQKLGQYFGIPQDVNMNEVALQGGLNAALPVAGKVASIGWNAVKSRVAPKIGSWATGIREDIIRALPDKLDQIEQMNSDGILSFGERTAKKAAHAVKRAQLEAMAAYDAALEKMGGKVDVSEAKKVLDDYVNKAQEAYDRIRTEPNEKRLNAAKEIRDYFFQKTNEAPITKINLGTPSGVELDPTTLTPKQGFSGSVHSQPSASGANSSVEINPVTLTSESSGISPISGQSRTITPSEASGVNIDALTLNSGMPNVSTIDPVTLALSRSGEGTPFRSSVGSGSGVMIDPVTLNPVSIPKTPNISVTLSQPNTGAVVDPVTLRVHSPWQSQPTTGASRSATSTTMIDPVTLNEVKPQEYISTELSPRDALKMTKDMRDEGNLRRMRDFGPFHRGELDFEPILAEARAKINVAMDNANPEFKKARSMWSELQDRKEIADDLFGEDEDVYKKLLGLGRKTNAGQYERVSRLDQAYPDAGIKNAIEDAQLHYYFGQPSNQAISIGGSTSTSRTLPMTIAGRDLGYTAGSAMSGGNSVIADTMGAAGGLIGSTLGAPSTVKNAIKASRWLEDLATQDPGLAKALIYGGTQELGKSPWENFR